MALSLEDIAHLLSTRGVNQYGREAVSQLEHALQCAQWAEKSGETPATVVAALLHDPVLEPIRLHVDAKRYLCTMEPGYWETLSPASQHSLVLQGGPFTPKEAMQFAAQPFAQEAIRLRRYDDHAKVPGLVTPPLGYYRALVQRLAPAPAAIAAAAELAPVAA